MARKTNGLSQWLSETAARLSGCGSKSRKYRNIKMKLQQLGLTRVPGPDDCLSFVEITGREFDPRACTLENLGVMAEIQSQSSPQPFSAVSGGAGRSVPSTTNRKSKRCCDAKTVRRPPPVTTRCRG